MFDQEVADYTRLQDVEYTRYADDLTFSTSEKGLLNEIKDGISQIVERTRLPRALSLNDEKTVYLSKKYNRHVTGVTLTSQGSLSIGRKRKREIRAAVHHFLIGKLSSDESQKLRGLLAFAKDIEPTFVERLIAKYGQKEISLIQRYRPE